MEQAIGQLKRRFSCLSVGIGLKLERVCQTILACVSLHNLSNNYADPDFLRAGKPGVADDDDNDEDAAEAHGMTDNIRRRLDENLRRRIAHELAA